MLQPHPVPLVPQVRGARVLLVWERTPVGQPVAEVLPYRGEPPLPTAFALCLAANWHGQIVAALRACVAADLKVSATLTTEQRAALRHANDLLNAVGT